MTAADESDERPIACSIAGCRHAGLGTMPSERPPCHRFSAPDQSVTVAPVFHASLDRSASGRIRFPQRNAPSPMSTDIPSPDDSPIQVTFSLSSPGARAVSVAIFFGRWTVGLRLAEGVSSDESPLKDASMTRQLVRLKEVEPGLWKGEVLLSPGSHEYLFVVDGAWVMDPDAPEVCPDYEGGYNAVRTVVSGAVPIKVPGPAASVAQLHRPALRQAG